MSSNTSKLEIINAALVLTGNSPIADESEDSDENRVAASTYDILARSELCSRAWRFCSGESVMNLTGETREGYFKYEWQMPSDVMILRTCAYKGYQTDEYKIEGSLVLSPYNSDLKAVYSRWVSEENWPADFIMAFTTRLQAAFAQSLNEDANGSLRLNERADMLFRLVKTYRGTQEPGRPLDDGPLIHRRKYG